MIAPGTYRLTRTLHVDGALTNTAIRGATSNAGDVALVGTGMTNPDYGAVPHGIAVGGKVDGMVIANLTIRDVFYHSTNGFTWTEIGSETVYIRKLAYVGLAVASRSPLSPTTAMFTNVAATATGPIPAEQQSRR